MPLEQSGKAKSTRNRESGDRPCSDETRKPSGVTAKEHDMTTTKLTAVQDTAIQSSALMQAVFALAIGGLIVFAAGFAQSQALHDAAHDVRHSTGFPCH